MQSTGLAAVAMTCDFGLGLGGLPFRVKEYF